jgi:transposase
LFNRTGRSAIMRGQADDQGPLFHVFSVEDRIRPDHPLRDIKHRADRILDGMSPQFTAASSRTGRPGVPPERLLKALLLMALCSVRCERQLCERIGTDLLFRWFLDLQPGEDVFDATTVTHNRQRLGDHALTTTFFAAVVREALTAGLWSAHFNVDGTLTESLAAAKSFRPTGASGDEPKDPNGFRPRNAEVDFRAQKRTNATHASRTDPGARLYRKGRGQKAKLAHKGHRLGENRHGLIMAVAVTEANGTAERTAALDMLDRMKTTHGIRPKTLGADKGFDDGEFFRAVEARQTEPHAPLVKGPRDLAAVPYHKQRPGVEARQRMKARMATEAYGHRGLSTQSEVPQEDRRGVRLAEGDRRHGPQPGGGSVEVAAGAGNRRRRLRPGATAGAEAGLRRRPGGWPAPPGRPGEIERTERARNRPESARFSAAC